MSSRRTGCNGNYFKFEIRMCYCFEGVNAYLPKTNNALEGLYRAFLQQVSSRQLTIWKFLESLKREQGLLEIHIAKEIAG